MENLSFRSSMPTVLGCSCANNRPPSFVPTMPSALSGPCQTSFHLAPAAITPGMPVTVTSFAGAGCGKASRCCEAAIPPRTRADTRKQEAVMDTALDFIRSRATIGKENKSSSAEVHPVAFDGKPHLTTGGDVREITYKLIDPYTIQRTHNRNGTISVDTEHVSRDGKTLTVKQANATRIYDKKFSVK